MPISQFTDAIQTFIKFLPGTYGTILFRHYFVRGATEKLAEQLPSEAIDGLRVGFDTKISFFGNEVSNGTSFLVVGVTALVLLMTFIVIVVVQNRAKKRVHQTAKVTQQ